MSQKLPVDGFKWKKNAFLKCKSNKKLAKIYDEDSDKAYIFEEDVKYPERTHSYHSDLPFFPQRMKINKCNKLVCNLHDKKTSIKSWSNTKKVHRVI